MKTLIYNLRYFLAEAFRTLRLHLFSNLLSIVGTALILLLLGMVISGLFAGEHLISKLNEEAEVSAYFTESADNTLIASTMESITALPGVHTATTVNAEDARQRMVNILGDEAYILDFFQDNPFAPFVEIQLDLQQIDNVVTNLNSLTAIDYVRDNRETLAQIQGFTESLKLLGSLIIFAVAITTVIIVSHMIRQAIYNNREQINTLRLLGAPNSFIGTPFVLAGLLLTSVGGVLATLLINFVIKFGFASTSVLMPFIPLPAQADLIYSVSLLLLGISFALGILGSLLGLNSIKTM